MLVLKVQLFFVVISTFLNECLPLRMLRVSVPAYRIRGQAALLECDYELGDDVLYSVKWYRDNEEFYRYLPKDKPPQNSYKLEGIKIDMSRSDDRRVTLHGVTLKSSGVYRCEVSAEAPSFASTQGEGRMEVIYLPKEGPRITGNEQKNRMGDFTFLNCTSGRSYPASILSWYINDEKVTDASMLVEYTPTAHAHGLLSSTLGLKVPGGRTLHVRCTARVAPAWREGRDAIVGEAHHTDSKEAMLLVRSLSKDVSPSLAMTTILVLVLLLSSFQQVTLQGT